MAIPFFKGRGHHHLKVVDFFEPLKWLIPAIHRRRRRNVPPLASHSKVIVPRQILIGNVLLDDLIRDLTATPCP